MYRLRISFSSSLFDKVSIDLEKLETAFHLYGPTVRNPLLYARNITTLDHLENAVNEAIRHYGSDKLGLLAQEEGSSDMSSKILCMFADGRGMPIYRIVSPYVGVKVYEHIQSGGRDELARWFRRFSNIPETGTPAGWLWENHCHKTLSRKSDLEITSLDDKKTEILKLVPSNQNAFRVLKAIPKKPSPGYYALVARNNQTFDAFSVTDTNQIVLMQFTVSPDHPPPKGTGLDDLADVLSNDLRPFSGNPWLFIWVVPKGMEDSVKAKNPVGGKRVGWQNKDTVKQYVASFEL